MRCDKKISGNFKCMEKRRLVELSKYRENYRNEYIDFVSTW